MQRWIIEIVSHDGFWVGLTTGLLVLFLGWIIRRYFKKPLLRRKGGSSEGRNVHGRQLDVHRARFYNDPRSFGIVADRDPAHIKSAILVDRSETVFDGTPRLKWRGDNEEYLDEVEIRPGNSAELFLLARYRDEETFGIPGGPNSGQDISINGKFKISKAKASRV